MGMRVKVKKRGDVPVLTVLGSVGGADTIQISKKLEAFSKKKAPVVALDLSAISFIDSNWMGVLVYAWKLYREKSKELVFIVPPGFIRDLFVSANLHRTFRLLSAVRELAALNGGDASHEEK